LISKESAAAHCRKHLDHPKTHNDVIAVLQFLLDEPVAESNIIPAANPDSNRFRAAIQRREFLYAIKAAEHGDDLAYQEHIQNWLQADYSPVSPNELALVMEHEAAVEDT